MLALTFLFPMVLAAGGAAAAPVIIHLIMRTKPHRVVFPAMRFVKKTHRAHIHKLRLKHLILLMMRMVAIVLIAMLLARPEIPAWGRGELRNVPVAAVVIVDNSGSMSYRHHGKALLDRGKTFAHRMVESLSPGSRVAVVSTGASSGGTGFRSDRKLVAQQITDVPPTFGSESVGPALVRAVEMLKPIDIKRKEVYLANDMTAQSWRDTPAMGETKDIDFAILHVGVSEPANIALDALRLNSGWIPVGTEGVIRAQVNGTRMGGECPVHLELDGRALEDRTVRVGMGGSAPVRFSFQPQREGTLHGRVVLDHPDPLEMDNVRYFTLQVARGPRMLVVRDPTTVGRGDETSFLMGSAVSPPVAEPGMGQWVRRETVTADRLDAERLREARIVMLCNVSSLAPSQWKLLEEFLRGGGCVWVVIGPLASPTAYNNPAAQRVLPVALKSLEESTEPTMWRAEDLRHPMLEPFTDGKNPPLSEVRHRRRFAIESVAGDANVVLRYADDVVGIVSRRVGDGSVVFWNFSPARSFSNLARLPQFVILSQRTVRLLSGAADVRTMYRWGQNVTIRVPRLLEGPLAAVRAGGEKAYRHVETNTRTRSVTVPADRLGHWTVRFTEDDRETVRGFSVNGDPSESDLRAVDPRRIRALFPVGTLTIASDPDQIAEKRGETSESLELGVPLLLGLLVLLIGESFFANRFYRRAEPLPPT